MSTQQNLSHLKAVLNAHPTVRDASLSWSDDAVETRQLIARVTFDPAAAPAQPNASKPIDFSLFFFGAHADTEQGADYTFYLDAARFADRHGFDAVWTPERHFHEVGGLYPNPATLSAALAMITERVKLRAGSVALPLHQVLRVAEEWAVVDCLSSGRAGVSIATGWHPRDFVLAPGHFKTRREDRMHGIELLRKLWAGEAITLEDGQQASTLIRIFPRPVQPTLPLSVTATGHPDTFEYAGRIGAGVLTHLWDQSIGKLGENLQVYRAALAAAGHAPETGRVTVMVHTFVSYDLERTRARCKPAFIQYMKKHLDLLRPALPPGEDIDQFSEREIDAVAAFAFKRYSQSAALIGTPDSCATIVEQLSGVGVDEVACLVDWLPPEDSRAALEPLSVLKDLARSSTSRIDAVRDYCRERLPAESQPDLIVEAHA
ncbi:MAG TPA: MupA/Atu3671 family FMN-dependent luciferase-like monooxygenase [Paraburkholderia sp.]|uniref:MupA/Atu3671 family FMN-dependent luciferase-like monooxygenase n=1 Tax=Paraburkholderia sp. TaxID=1926495 RepID=UPI002ED35E87